MKNDTLKLKIFRAYHSIRGWNMLRKFKHGKYYSTPQIKNTRFYYNKDHEFYAAYVGYVCPGVAYTDQRKKTFKNWEISILNLKEG